jgi:carbamoyltransferase
MALLEGLPFPHSLGLLYSSFTAFLGFRVNSGEYKVMGLAPYGAPKFSNIIRDKLIDLRIDGSFRLNLDFFSFPHDGPMISDAFGELFKCGPRTEEDPINSEYCDIASSIQYVLNQAMVGLARRSVHLTGNSRLCMAGGVALNCVANTAILRDGSVKEIWIQPASGDSGGALGAAMAAHYLYADGIRNVVGSSDSMQGSLLGPGFSDEEVIRTLQLCGATFQVCPDEDMLMERTSSAIAAGLVVGWFQGRMEFGPRALGNRSILADARSPAMQSILNEKIKQRESFRPFAPAVLAEDIDKYFDSICLSPYMLLIGSCRDDSLPAVTHLDGSSRIQTVNKTINPQFHSLLSHFKKLTGCSVMVNTSFNVRGEPIVCSPRDAYNCFMSNDMDMLVIGPCILLKQDQPSSQQIYASKYEPDWIHRADSR